MNAPQIMLKLGLPVLHHFGVEYETLLEEGRNTLVGADFSKCTARNEGGNISGLVITRLIKVSNEEAGVNCKDERRRSLEFYTVRFEKDAFPDASLLDTIDYHQHHEIIFTVEKMINDAVKNNFPLDETNQLKTIVSENIDIFRTSLSSGRPRILYRWKLTWCPLLPPCVYDFEITLEHNGNFSSEPFRS